MKKRFVALAFLCAAMAVPGHASAANLPVAGQMLFSADGKRVAPINRVREDGAVQVIINGRMFLVPAETITVADGRTSTTLGRSELLASR